jgi:ribonuclease E
MRFGFRKSKDTKTKSKAAVSQKADGQEDVATLSKTENGKTKARRKSLGQKSKMLINAVESEEFRIAVIKDGRLDGFHIETTATEQKTGNIYKGVVERIEPSLQACFVNFGSDKNGFLSVTDIHPEYYAGSPMPKKKHPLPRIEKILKKGQELLVQVTKEMQGHKGAQLTTYLSLASRHLVLMPGSKGGISKKIEDEEERQRLKSIMAQFKLPEGVGYIVRTAALKQSKREISRDLNRLLRMWKNIKKNVQEASSLTLVHKEQDVCLRTLRDYFTSEINPRCSLTTKRP